jgi:hypothetical protein
VFSRSLFLVGICVIGSIGAANAGIVVLDFEGLLDGDPVGATYAGLGATFTNELVATAGVSLNEADLPPHSGVNVLFDFSGPIRIDFSSFVGSFSAYFTYTTTLNITAFDAVNSPVATATSAFAANFVSSGNPPNELLQTVFNSGIDHVVIAGDPAGGSFVMDDVAFDTSVGASPVPEPSGLALVIAGLFAMVVRQGRRRIMGAHPN